MPTVHLEPVIPNRAGGPSNEEIARVDRALVERAVAGDRDAFEAIYRRYQNRVYGVSMRLAADRVEAEELVQETFVKAWTALGGFGGRGSLGGWLARIAINRWKDRWRDQHRRNTVALDDDGPANELEHRETAAATGTGHPADAAVIPLLTAMDLERCIERLPRGARAVYVLHEIEGFPHHEIAAQMGLATGTVKAQLHRARKLLRVMLTDGKEKSHEA